MAGLSFKFSLKDMGAGKAVEQLHERITRPQAMLKEIGLLLLSSIQQNFQKGGRPVRWKPSQRAENQHGQTLRDTGRLQNSITMKISGKTLTLGTNVKYAAIHQFGGKINKTVVVKAHIRYLKKLGGYKKGGKTYYPYASISTHSRKMDLTMPARPFLMVQDEDWRRIKRIGEDYLAKGQGNV